MSDRSESLIAKAERHLLAGNTGLARKTLGKALKARPDDPELLERLAGLELKARNPKGAVPLLRKLAERQPGQPETRLRLAAAQEDARDLAGAEETLRALNAEHPDYAEAYNNLGNLLQLRDAFAAYSQTLGINPGLAPAWVNAGNALDEMGKYGDAVSHYSKAIALDPYRAEIHYFRGRARTALGEPEKALADVEQCLRFDPADQKGLALQAVLFATLGRHDEEKALFDYDRFVRPIRPEPPEGYATIEAFNTELIDHIRNRVALAFDPYGVSTHGGWHSGNLLADQHPTMTSLRAMLQRLFQTYLSELPSDDSHPFLRRSHSDVRLVAQAQILESQGFLATHIHPGGWVSSAYYLSVPEVVAQGEDKPGWLEFGRPTSEIKTGADLEIRAVKPEPGLAVLFPSYFFHGTRPFESKEQRISMGIDLIAKR